MELLRIYRSARHIYFGHFGGKAGTTPIEELAHVDLAPGGGIPGDRFTRQVTFFAEETWLRLQADLTPPGPPRDAGVFRRNLLVRAADLNALIGQDFELQGVRFTGLEYCKPCFWMDQAFAPGTLQRLTDWKAGGLRARIVAGGTLRAGANKAPSP